MSDVENRCEKSKFCFGLLGWFMPPFCSFESVKLTCRLYCYQVVRHVEVIVDKRYEVFMEVKVYTNNRSVSVKCNIIFVTEDLKELLVSDFN